MRAPASGPRMLKRGMQVDPFTHALYACSPYRGCGHGCVYCDGRAEKYFVEGDFERDIVVRAHAAESLAVEVQGLREWGAISLGSGVTDAYQPCEREHRLVRRLAQVLATMPDHREAGGIGPLPVVILTKSAHILDDLACWTQVNARSSVLVMVSITSLDEDFRRAFEPGASPFEDRLEVLRQFKEAGCLTGALVMPLLPGLTEEVSSLRALLQRLKEARVDFVLPGGLTLRPGRQKEGFFQTLQAVRPDLVGTYTDIFREERASGAPTWIHRKAMESRIQAAVQGLDLAWQLPHAGLRRLMEPPDELAALLRQMAWLYSTRGVDVRALTQAAARYEAWLKDLRSAYRRQRTLAPGWMTERLVWAVEHDELRGVLGNEKLSRFAARVVLDRALLDARTLRLSVP